MEKIESNHSPIQLNQVKYNRIEENYAKWYERKLFTR